MDEPQLRRAAAVLDEARAVVVAAGAGMGVDSGLPDFRGDEGFWHAYPPYRSLGVSFVEMANPRGFRDDPELAWGFYGHRRALYRRTTPHEGFVILRRWIAAAPDGGAVFTSNVDGQFQVAGFAPGPADEGVAAGDVEVPVYECHGSIHVDQCLRGCGHPLWPAGDVEVEVDDATMRAVGPLPRCPGCGGLARPNILMFGDGGWDPTRADRQAAALDAWLGRADLTRTVVVEIGAGTAVPSVRHFSERAVRQGASLVRINPREPQVPAGQLGLATGARAALRALDAERGGA